MWYRPYSSYSYDTENDHSRIIAAVKRHEYLYAEKYMSKTSENNKKRREAWKQIGDEIGKPASECKELWQKIRNSYWAFLKRAKTNRGHLRKWGFEDELRFLLPHMGPFIHDLHTPILPLTPEPQTSKASTYQQAVKDTDTYFSLYLNEKANQQQTPEVIELESDAEEIPEDGDDGTRDSDKSSGTRSQVEPDITMNGEPERGADVSGLDDTDLFFLSVSRSAKKLPERLQARLKVAVRKVVLDAERSSLEDEVLDMVTKRGKGRPRKNFLLAGS